MKYRTKDGQDYTLPGIGRTVNGVITTDQKIENPNFELVEESAPPAAPSTPPAPATPPQLPSQPSAPAAPTNQGSNN